MTINLNASSSNLEILSKCAICVYIKSQKVSSACMFAPWECWRKYRGWCKFASPLRKVRNYTVENILRVILSDFWFNHVTLWFDSYIEGIKSLFLTNPKGLKKNVGVDKNRKTHNHALRISRSQTTRNFSLRIFRWSPTHLVSVRKTLYTVDQTSNVNNNCWEAFVRCPYSYLIRAFEY